MKKQLVSFAITTSLLTGAHNVYATEKHTTEIRNSQHVGTGIGAVAGAIFAGPVGFVAGGLLGNLAGKHDAISSIENEKHAAISEPSTADSSYSSQAQTSDNTAVDTIIVAQAGEPDSVIDGDPEQTSKLKDILISELNMDIFFLSGSTAVEAFYQSRLNAVAKLMHEIPDTDIYLDGYSDRRGDRDTNLALSTRRLESVRMELVQAGVDENRIHINALGEQQFVSKAGDLEAYTFDRRVVIRFGESVPASTRPIAQIETIPAI
jgi:sortase system peptidoglycan-associated protein